MIHFVCFVLEYHRGEMYMYYFIGIKGSGMASLATILFDLGYDPMDNVSLYLEKEPSEIQILTKDGLCSNVSFEKVSTNTYVVDTRIEPLYPVILLIK